MRSSGNVLDDILIPLDESTSSMESIQLSLTPLPTTSLSSPINISPITLSPRAPSPGSQNEMQKRKRKIKENTDSDMIFMEAMESFKKLCKSKEEKLKKSELDPVHGFAKMIIATISSMNGQKQAKAMQQLTELVMKIKYEPEL